MARSRVPRAVTSGNMQTTREYYSGVLDWRRTDNLRAIVVVPTWYVAFHRRVGLAVWSGKRRFSYIETA
jgi:hypothetical protein